LGDFFSCARAQIETKFPFFLPEVTFDIPAKIYYLVSCLPKPFSIVFAFRALPMHRKKTKPNSANISLDIVHSDRFLVACLIEDHGAVTWMKIIIGNAAIEPFILLATTNVICEKLWKKRGKFRTAIAFRGRNIA